MALAATADLFSEEDSAAKILPAICPSLIDKEKYAILESCPIYLMLNDFVARVVRDSANKTLDIFLQRVRKHAQGMPDTVLPPPNAPGIASASAQQAGTSQNDSSSWAGWAISSFTNKLAAATGEIQSASNGAAQKEPRRPASVPPKSPNTTLNTSAAPVNRSALSKSTTPANPFASAASNTPSITSGTSEIETEDFGAEWGDDFNHTSTAKGKAEGDASWSNGWDDDAANDFSDPFTASATSAETKTAVSYDDHGEPDFAGWLAAQTQAKQKAKNPLPKGLSKAGAARPGAGLKSNSTGNVSTVPKKQALVSTKSKPAPTTTKTQETGKAEEDDEGWGDAWG